MRCDGRDCVVVGLGRSGQAAARLIVAQGGRATCTDLRPRPLLPAGFLEWCHDHDVAVETGAHRIETLSRADLVVVSPGVPWDLPVLQRVRESGVPMIGELVLAASAWRGPILAITGTNGKTTTTELVGAMLEEAGIPCVVAGNIGLPLSACLLQGWVERTAVLEVSSFQLDACAPSAGVEAGLPPFVPKVAAWLNLAPDHLDRYPSLAAYGASKARILAAQGPRDWAVLNGDDRNLRPWSAEGRGQRLLFGAGRRDVPGAWWGPEEDRISVVWPDGPEEGYGIEAWSLVGAHNRENLLAAILVARLAGVQPDAVQRAVGLFRPPEHRLQWVACRGGVDYYDDSKATNVAAVLRAVEALGRPVVLIAGGRGKGEDYAALGETLRGRARAAVVLGEEQRAIRAVLEGVTTVVSVPQAGPGPSKVVPPCQCDRADGMAIMRLAVKAAAGVAEAGDIVLLAPACASFDLFENYVARGQAFQKAVHELGSWGRAQ